MTDPSIRTDVLSGTRGRDFALAGRSAARTVVSRVAFGLFALFVMQVAAGSLAGFGGAFGWGSDATVTPGVRMPTRFRSIAWGGTMLHLREGQRVRVAWSAEIAKGVFVAGLRRRFDLSTPRAYGPVIATSGDGSAELRAPAAGWYRVTMFTRPTLAPAELKARSVFGPRENARGRYRMSWRVID
jgi:hypothetical protein